MDDKEILARATVYGVPGAAYTIYTGHYQREPWSGVVIDAQDRSFVFGRFKLHFDGTWWHSLFDGEPIITKSRKIETAVEKLRDLAGRSKPGRRDWVLHMPSAMLMYPVFLTPEEISTLAQHPHRRFLVSKCGGAPFIQQWSTPWTVEEMAVSWVQQASDEQVIAHCLLKKGVPKWVMQRWRDELERRGLLGLLLAS